MSHLRAFSIRAMTRVVVPCLAVCLSPLPAAAQSNTGNYIFLLASGFLCDPGESFTCPATGKATQGDTYEMSGAGTFEAQSKSVKAAGTFSHKSPNGNVLETGVWLAGELVSFDSYGAAPGALLRQGLAFGPAPFGPKAFADVLRSHADRRTCGIPYPSFADVRPVKNRCAGNELRLGRSAPRTLGGGDSTHFRKEWQGIF